jgi:hypothetical protein
MIRIFVHGMTGPIETDELTFEEMLAGLANPDHVFQIRDSKASTRYAIPARNVRSVSEDI